MKIRGKPGHKFLFSPVTLDRAHSCAAGRLLIPSYCVNTAVAHYKSNYDADINGKHRARSVICSDTRASNSGAWEISFHALLAHSGQERSGSAQEARIVPALLSALYSETRFRIHDVM